MALPPQPPNKENGLSFEWTEWLQTVYQNLQTAQDDITGQPTTAGAETITGAWTFTGGVTFTTGNIVAGTIDADFDAVTATSYGGILEANLLDKTAAETITGVYTFSDAVVGGGGNHIDSNLFAVKTADENVANSTTLQNDDDLVFAAAANKFYRVTCVIELSAGSTAPDFKYNWTFPTGATFTGFIHDITSTRNCNSSTPNGSFGLSSNKTFHTFEFLLQTAGTAGNFQFQWAQNTSDANNTTVHQGSWIEAREIPA